MVPVLFGWIVLEGKYLVQGGGLLVYNLSMNLISSEKRISPMMSPHSRSTSQGAESTGVLGSLARSHRSRVFGQQM